MDSDKLLAQPTHRRGWLLLKALECVPLDQAIDLARAADLFVVGNDDSEVDAVTSMSAARAQGVEPSREPEAAVKDNPLPGKSLRVGLTTSQRADLLDRAANGAKNAELAAEFGLKPRQVQGLRMAAARANHSSVEPDTASTVCATAEEVVRYLRQRDDVVVPDREGTYLVNGRFRLNLAELVAKANRARSREKQPLFRVGGITDEANPLRPNGHPVFWPTSSADNH